MVKASQAGRGSLDTHKPAISNADKPKLGLLHGDDGAADASPKPAEVKPAESNGSAGATAKLEPTYAGLRPRSGPHKRPVDVCVEYEAQLVLMNLVGGRVGRSGSVYSTVSEWMAAKHGGKLNPSFVALDCSNDWGRPELISLLDEQGLNMDFEVLEQEATDVLEAILTNYERQMSECKNGGALQKIAAYRHALFDGETPTATLSHA